MFSTFVTIFFLLRLLMFLVTVFSALCCAYLIIFFFFKHIPTLSYDPTIFDLQEFHYSDVKKCHRDSSSSTNGNYRFKQHSSRLTPTTAKRRIVVSRDIDKVIQEIVDELLSYYIFSWYKPLLNDDHYSHKCLQHLRQVLRQDSWLLISTFIDRLYTVNYLPFITSTLSKRLLKHFESLQNCDNIASSRDNVSLTDSYDLLSSSSSSSSTFQSLLIANQHNLYEQQSSSTSLLAEAVKNINSKFQTLNSSQNLKNFSSSTSSFLYPSYQQVAKSENSKYFLQTFLFNKHDEEQLQHRFIHYILDILFRESRYTTRFTDHSQIVSSLLNDVLSCLMKQTFESITDPYFINLQILKLIRHYQFNKDVNLNEYVTDSYNIEKSLNFDRKSQIITEMRKHLNDNNFSKIYDIIDGCDEIDLLKSIRLLIVGEILNVSVIEHLSRLKDRKNRNKRGSKHNIEFKSNSLQNPANSGQFSALINTKIPIKNSLMNFLHLNSSVDNQMSNNSKLANIKLNVPNESKIKLLQIKDLRRFNNHLRLTKTLCEQKILTLKRQNAKQIFDVSNVNNRRLSINSNLTLLDDSLSFFELSNSHLDANASLVNNNNESLNNTFKINEKFFIKNKKKIYQFKMIIVNDISREWLKRFVMNSLFSQDIIRSSKNQFKIDSLLSQCCSYLIDVWECCERVFEKCFYYYQKVYQDGGEEEKTNLNELNQLIHDCYLQTVSIVYDERFAYTFSNKFLELPVHILQHLENFLVGQLSLSMIELDNKYYDFNNFLKITDFDPEIIENTSGITNLIRLKFEPLWKIFYEFENIIHHCLQEEIYPQFLISNEYDQMLIELDDSNKDAKITDPFMNFNHFSFGDKWKLSFDSLSLSNSFQSRNNGEKGDEENNNNENNPHQRLKDKKNVNDQKNIIFEKLFLSNKPLQKIVINSEMIDLTKNRNILLNSLEFGFGTFIYLKSLCEARLKFKIFLKHLLTRNFKQKEINNEKLIINKIAKILKEDVLLYHSLYNDIHKVLVKSFLWLHFDFVCKSSDLKLIHFVPESSQSASGKPSTLKSNKFLSSLVGNLIGSFEQQSGDYDLQFSLHIQAKLSPTYLQQFDNDLKNQLKYFSHDWMIPCSVNCIQNWLTNNLTPNLRMLTFLSRFNSLHYLHVLTTNIGLQINSERRNFSVAEWKDFSRRLFNDETILLKLMKERIKNFQLLGLTKKNSNSTQSMSFKSLLKNDDSLSTLPSLPSSSSTSSISTLETTTRPESASAPTLASNSYLKYEWPLKDEQEITSKIDKLLKSLSTNQHIVRMNAFLALIKFQDSKNNSSLICSGQCLRCQLYDLLLNNSWSELNVGLLASLFRFLAAKNDLNNSCLNLFDDKQQQQQHQQPNFVNPSRQNSSSSKDTDANDNTVTAISVSGLATGRLFAMQSNTPTLSSAENGGDLELFLLHSRSLLMDRPAIEIFDYLLANFRYFGNFCPECVGKITQSRPIQASSVTGSNKIGMTVSNKFRLFQQFDNSSVGIDVAASLEDNSNSLEVLEDDAADGEEEDAVVEQLFQLLIEVFQLKGSVAKTFRRTLMLAFRLLFGSTMVSKHLKLILESVFADKNILSWLNDILGMTKEWNAELEQNRTHRCQEMSSTGQTLVEDNVTPSFNEQLNNILDDLDLKVQSDSSNSESDEQLKRLQILTKQLLFTSVPSFASALFGQENLNSGLNKCFDILQYRQLNKQLCYEFLEAFTFEYFSDNIKK